MASYPYGGGYNQPPPPGLAYPAQPLPGQQPGYYPATMQPSPGGYPGQPGYPAQPGGYYPGQPPTQTIIVQEDKKDDDCAKDCCICALCAALCCFCLND